MAVAENTIRANSLGECWLECNRLVLQRGEHGHDEDVPLLELLGVTVGIDQPNVNDSLIMQHGDQTVIRRTLEKFAPGARMPDRPFTYGERIFELGGVNQFDWLVQRLNGKTESKSATINLLVPGEDGNLPCLVTMDAKIRKKALTLQFFYRSQNVFGRQYANFLALAAFQAELAGCCGVAVGAMRGYIASAHIYGYDIDDAKRLVAGEQLTIADRYYQCGPASVRQAGGRDC